MKLDIPIEADREIRKYAKKLIEGQLKGLVRSEIREIIHEEATRILRNDNEMSEMVREAAKAAAKFAVDKTTIRRMVVDNTTENIKEIIEKLAITEIRRAFSVELGEMIRQHLGPIIAETTLEVSLGKRIPDSELEG